MRLITPIDSRFRRNELRGYNNPEEKKRLQHVDGRDVAATYLRWTFLRTVFHRGYVLTSGLYFVVVAHLSASQIVLLGTAMSITLALADIPTGVWSDAGGRRWPLVIGHLFLAAGMAMTGAVTAFPLMVVTQVLWGLGWAFLTGADVAWITDELAQPQRIARVLSASVRWELAGGATGMIAFGLLGWTTSLATAIVVSGSGMALLGLFVAVRFAERNFVPRRGKRWIASLAVFRLGISLVRRDREILLVCAATMIINGAGVIGWLFPKQLAKQGFPSNLILWYTALGICSSALGFVALRIVEAHIDSVGVARRVYALTCFIGMFGLFALAFAPNAIIGSAGILLTSGIAFNVTRTVGIIWVNRRTTSDVRATIRSFLDQAEAIGEICGGFMLALIAGTGGMLVTILTAAALIAFTGALVALSRADR